MAAHLRYRIENGDRCIDVRLGRLEQLFDNRDPAPFRERDLDLDLIEYLMAGAEDLAAHGPFRVVFWFVDGQHSSDVEHAYRAHFEYELDRLGRKHRRQRRVGEVSLAIGVTLLVMLLSLAQVVESLSTSSITKALREGLLILAWVVMWRPVEALIYDWLPLRRERQLMTRLRTAAVDVRTGKPPEGGN